MKQHTLWHHVLPFVELGVCHYSDSHTCARTYHTSSLHYLSHFKSQQKELNFLSTDHEYVVYLPETNWRSLSFPYTHSLPNTSFSFSGSLEIWNLTFWTAKQKILYHAIYLWVYLLVTQQILNRFLSDLVNVWWKHH